MSKKAAFFATALSTLAFVVLPAVASAGTPEVHCPNGVSSCAINISGGQTQVTRKERELKMVCNSVTGSGSLDTTGGSFQLKLHGCKDTLFGMPCTTTGQPSGTVTTTVLPVDNRYVTAGKTAPGILVTPNAGGAGNHFATFSCVDGVHTLNGNGVMASLVQPGCGGSNSTLKYSFAQTANGVQTHKQITGAGVIYDLTETGVTGALVTELEITAGGGNFLVTCV